MSAIRPISMAARRDSASLIWAYVGPSHHRSSVPLRFRPPGPASISAVQHLPHIGARPRSHDPSTLGSPRSRDAAWRPLASLAQNSQRSTPRAQALPFPDFYAGMSLQGSDHPLGVGWAGRLLSTPPSLGDRPRSGPQDQGLRSRRYAWWHGGKSTDTNASYRRHSTPSATPP